MARIFASFCVCSFLVLNSLCQPVLAVTEFPLDFRRLCVIPEADGADQQIPDLKSIGQPPCQFLRRHLTASRSNCQTHQVIESSVSSCPIESQFVTEGRPPEIWNKAWAKLSEQSENLFTWTAQTAQRFSQKMNHAVIEIVDRQNLRARNFVNEIQRFVPIQSENTFPVSLPGTQVEKEESPTDHDSDQYWQYYEDCDHWNVIFALATRHSQFDVACLTSQGVVVTRNNQISQLLDGLVSRNFLKTIGTTIQLITEFHHVIDYQYRIQEFRDVESLGIRFAKRKRTISRSLRAGWESNVQAVSGFVSQVKLEHFISLKRSYPANALRSGIDQANRFSSLR